MVGISTDCPDTALIFSSLAAVSLIMTDEESLRLLKFLPSKRVISKVLAKFSSAPIKYAILGSSVFPSVLILMVGICFHSPGTRDETATFLTLAILLRSAFMVSAPLRTLPLLMSTTTNNSLLKPKLVVFTN